MNNVPLITESSFEKLMNITGRLSEESCDSFVDLLSQEKNADFLFFNSDSV